MNEILDFSLPGGIPIWDGTIDGVDYGLDFREWCTGDVTYMAGLFADRGVMDERRLVDGIYYPIDLSLWDVSSVTDMSSMFSYSVFGNDIGISAWMFLQ